MKKYLKALRGCQLFDLIEDGDLEKMLGCLGAEVRVFDKRQTVLAEGEAAKSIGIVLSGSVQIVRVDCFGNRSIIGNIGVSEMFAEAFACAGVEALPVSAVANEPGEIMLLDCGHILRTCSNNCGFHRQMIFNLMKGIAVKAIAYHQKIEVISKRSTRSKLMAFLSMQSKKAESRSFEIPFDRQELADYLEVERSGLSAEISRLRKEGIIENRKKRFVLL